MNTPWLIQRAKINKPLAPPATKLSDAVRFDYMGSAEFEFGALPESLRRIEKRFESSTICLIDWLTEDSKPLRVFSPFNDGEYNEYVDFLDRLRSSPLGFVRLKERSEFSLAERSSAFEKGDTSYLSNFWWDITNDVMFSFHKEFMNRLPEYLHASFKYMNERKAS